MASDNKRIAKNTLFLYIRMFIIMGVTLFTSRVILDKLGVTDYGLYNVVGGVVGMLSFLNGTLSIGTSRFLTYEIGTGNKDKLWRTFNTAFYSHLVLSFIIVLLMETAGMWFLYNKLVIPDERLNACFWVFQLSLLTTFVNISQVPYNSMVSSHERFNIYAYVSIFEALAKLGICYLITVTIWDRLIFYAALIALIQISVAMYYRYYCNRNFEESHLALSFDKNIFKSILSFSGWNIVANLTETLKFQGVVVLINLFLSPVVVASQALANQVSHALMGFVNNFRMAFNPQIIKLYAAGDIDGSKRLTLQATIVCFDLVLLLALPFIYCMKTIMSIWLVEVPDYAVIYTQYILVINVVATFSTSFYIPMLAANKIKKNSIASVILGIGQFVMLYIVLRLGGGPLWVPVMLLLIAVCFSLFVKPYILWKDINYSIKELLSCYFDCLKVLILSLVISFPIKYFIPDTLWGSVVVFIIAVLSVIVSSIIFMDISMRSKIFSFIKSKIKH